MAYFPSTNVEPKYVTNNTIKNGFTTNDSYTATEDGILCGYINNQGGSSTIDSISIDGVVVASCRNYVVIGDTSYYCNSICPLYAFVKKGQVITTSSTGNFAGAKIVRAMS